MNKLVIVSGPSGSGKTTLLREVMNNEIVSTTTREKRPGEVEGKDYYFVSQEEYDRIMEEGKFVEYTTYYGNASYGITSDEIETKLSRGHAFAVVDVTGKGHLEALVGKENTVSLFVVADKDIIRQRMEKRGDSPEEIEKRLSTYEEEISNKDKYDYVIVNNKNIEAALFNVKLVLHQCGVYSG